MTVIYLKVTPERLLDWLEFSVVVFKLHMHNLKSPDDHVLSLLKRNLRN